MTRGPGRTGSRWQKLRRQVLAEATLCVWCHEPLRPELRWPHRLSSTVDHLVSLIEGGHPTDRANLAGAHLGCNAKKENARRRQRASNTSRDW
jgi:5-methylcytosine-specific restriction endonuclease McrA